MNQKGIFIRKVSVRGALDYLSPKFDHLIPVPFLHVLAQS